MSRKQKIINAISLVLLILVFWNFFKPNQAQQNTTVQNSSTTLSAFEKALDCKCDQDFVVTSDLKVVKKLKDGTKGVRHQKWLVQNQAGQIILFVHNLDLCQSIQLEKNDIIQLAGQFKWTDKGALIHWTHYDPNGKRPNGYVFVAGRKYCDQPN